MAGRDILCTQAVGQVKKQAKLDGRIAQHARNGRHAAGIAANKGLNNMTLKLLCHVDADKVNAQLLRCAAGSAVIRA